MLGWPLGSGRKGDGKASEWIRSPLIGRREVGIAEDGIGAADVADGAEVGERKAVEVLGLVAHRSKFKAAVTDGQSATVPVVDGLDARVLDGALDKVVSAIDGEVETRAALFSDSEKGLRLLALDGGSGAPALVDGIE